MKSVGQMRLTLFSAVSTGVAFSLITAPPTMAKYSDALAEGVAQVRQAAPCAPLAPDPIVERAAEVAAGSTSRYLNHNARTVPVVDPLPILKDFGLDVGKARLLQGAAASEADAVKALLISGFQDIPDCSYTLIGVSALSNDNPDGFYLTAVVLAGP